MLNLYCTADRVSELTGGGAVTHNEYAALCGSQLPTKLIDGKVLNPDLSPFAIDSCTVQLVKEELAHDQVKVAHFYAGTFSQTVRLLRSAGAFVSYTAAAHSIEDSRLEYQYLNQDFAYPHLTDPKLWAIYVDGYKEADLVICPSHYSASVMRQYGCTRVTVIPHGCHVPAHTTKGPQVFTVGYLGAQGPDKGVVYLLKAWEKLNLKDAILVLGGRQSCAAIPFIRQCNRGNIRLRGWLDNVSDFYNDINVYVQPSVTEGFGIEIIEAMAHARAVIASDGAGAHECITDAVTGYTFKKRSVDELAERIKFLYDNRDTVITVGQKAREEAAPRYDWKTVQAQYMALWSKI